MSHHHDDRDDSDAPLTEADVTSETRFGPRPVPEGHRRLNPDAKPRRIPPHGDVSPDGKHVWPRPSRAARWLVWGGTALAVAGVTAGAVIAARKVSGAGGNDARPAPSRIMPPGPQPSGHAPWQDEKPRPRRPRHKRRFMDEVEHNTATLGASVDGVMSSLTAAMSGFRTVAGQAGAIMREFSDAADLVRNVMGDAKPTRHRKARRPASGAPTNAGAYADRHGTPMPDLHDDPQAADPAHDVHSGESRLHRL